LFRQVISMPITVTPPPASVVAPEVGKAPPALPPLAPSWYGLVKVVADFVLALALFVLLLPVMLAVAALVKLRSRGPALYKQTRLGKHGRPFLLYKVRTMVHDCEKLSGPQWSRPGDPRITRLGAFLRRTHLDELPQLWNVLRGEMSLVGPRPERPEFVPALAEAIPGYLGRLQVRPGVTGLAQVTLPADTDLDSVRRKLVSDLHYVTTFDPWLDLRILLATGLKMFGTPFHLIGRVFRLPRLSPDERAGRLAREERDLQPPCRAAEGWVAENAPQAVS
jgi:lipopolysaccharide/colanic/teichoic acid biosynthesis glycosyltransferase